MSYKQGARSMNEHKIENTEGQPQIIRLAVRIAEFENQISTINTQISTEKHNIALAENNIKNHERSLNSIQGQLFNYRKQMSDLIKNPNVRIVATQSDNTVTTETTRSYAAAFKGHILETIVSPFHRVNIFKEVIDVINQHDTIWSAEISDIIYSVKRCKASTARTESSNYAKYMLKHGYEVVRQGRGGKMKYAKTVRSKPLNLNLANSDDKEDFLKHALAERDAMRDVIQ